MKASQHADNGMVRVWCIVDLEPRSPGYIRQIRVQTSVPRDNGRAQHARLSLVEHFLLKEAVYPHRPLIANKQSEGLSDWSHRTRRSGVFSPGHEKESAGRRLAKPPRSCKSVRLPLSIAGGWLVRQFRSDPQRWAGREHQLAPVF